MTYSVDEFQIASIHTIPLPPPEQAEKYSIVKLRIPGF
jgi:hypothetical protein